MKKILLSLAVIFILIGCGETKPKAYTIIDKNNTLVIALYEKDDKTLEELNKNMEAWKKLSEKGDEQAKKEYQEWQAMHMIYDNDPRAVEINYSAIPGKKIDKPKTSKEDTKKTEFKVSFK